MSNGKKSKARGVGLGMIIFGLIWTAIAVLYLSKLEGLINNLLSGASILKIPLSLIWIVVYLFWPGIVLCGLYILITFK